MKVILEPANNINDHWKIRAISSLFQKESVAWIVWPTFIDYIIYVTNLWEYRATHRPDIPKYKKQYFW